MIGYRTRMNWERLVSPPKTNPVTLCNHFYNEPTLVDWIPDEQERRHVAFSFLGSAIRAGMRYGEVLTTEERDSMAVWIRPEHDLSFRRLMVDGFDQSPRYLKLAASVEASRQHLAHDPHWYLLALWMDASTRP